MIAKPAALRPATVGGMRFAWALLWFCLPACSPVQVSFTGDPEPVSTVPNVPVDHPLTPAVLYPSAAGPQSCAASLDRSELGPYSQHISATPAASHQFLWSSGILAGDLDGDHVIDLVAPAEPYAELYRGQADGSWAPSHRVLEDFDLSYGVGGSLADYDGDGDLDVLVLRYEAADVLLRNDGGGAFTDVSVEAGIDGYGPSTSSAWADVDHDGDLDLFIGTYGDEDSHSPARSWLYENLGDGRFTDRSHLLPESAHTAFTRVAGFHDLDGDGWSDLYLVNGVSSATPNVVLRNVAGRWVDDLGAMGLDLANSGSGLGVGDIDGDGRLDLVVPQWRKIAMLKSEADGGWIDWASASGMVPDVHSGQEVGWGAELADIDNDGDLDAIVAFGHLEGSDLAWDNSQDQPDALFLQQPDGTFVDAAAEWGVDDDGTGRGFAVADFDGDGWLDLAKRDVAGPSRLYNSRCGDAGWLRIELEHTGSMNRFAVGASVAVIAGDRRWTRVVRAGGTGFGTGGPPEVHVGLGEASRVDRVEVTWPDGERSVVGPVEPRQVVVIQRPR